MITQRKFLMWIFIGIVFGSQLFANPFYTCVKIFDHNDYSKYVVFKVPSIVCTANNTLVIAVDARSGPEGRDWHPSDCAIKRSQDGGKTWSPLQVVVDGISKNQSFSDHRLIAERGTNTVHLIYAIQYAKMYHIKSTDAGETWSEPNEITDIFETYRDRWNWAVLAPGAGHGYQTHDGRLVCAPWIAKKRNHDENTTVFIYSDDHGDTWHAGGIIFPAEGSEIFNETTVVRLNSGKYLANGRFFSKTKRRSIAYSDNGIDGWSKAEFDYNLADPQCCASIIRYDDKNILFSNNDSRTKSRVNLTIKVSKDDCKTWYAAKRLWNKAGYSDIAVDNDGFIYVYHDDWTLGNENARPNRQWIQKMNLEFITGVETGKVIKTLFVDDRAEHANFWSIQQDIQKGDMQYGDRISTITSIPEHLIGQDWIRTANDSRHWTGESLVSFNTKKDSYIYIAHSDAISTKPTWLSTDNGWTDTGEDLVNDESKKFSLFVKKYERGTFDVIGENGGFGQDMFTIIVKPVE